MERLDAFMARANAEYYARRDPFADFTTSPEITQAFGEVLGAWAAVVWEQAGRPDPVLLAECGPGRGTLMADALRLIARVAPAFRSALRLHLIETSPRLRAIQAEALPEAQWHDDLAALPDGPLILIANEFLDALPIRQLVRRDGGWTERFVDRGRFVETALAPALSPEADQGRAEDLAEGRIVELREPAREIAAHLAARLSRAEGAALFLDYGPAASAPGDSLQALRGGAPADPLADPGAADLTAHVDFAGFARAAEGADVHGPVPQGRFLAALGLFQRTDRLAQTLPPARAMALKDAARRLAEPNRMGGLFKALALCHPGQPTPPGFE